VSTGVFLVTTACAGCGACLVTCPERALRPAAPGEPSPIVTLADRCTACGECMEVCPADAIVEARR
jgi:Pyruvate/2-oxoacid:ferredoxin oxidoreductase delta subunit